MENRKQITCKYQNLSTKSETIRTKCKELLLTDEQINEVACKISHQIECGLGKDTHNNADIKCYITYIQDVPTCDEEGRYLALDLSDSNFRFMLIDLDEDCEIHSKIYEICLSFMTGPGYKLFDYIAECLATFMIEQKIQKEKLPLGFIFSFPFKHFGLSKGVLIKWTKGFSCSGVIGKDVVQLLRDAIARRGDIEINVCAILNDSVCAMLSCACETRNCKVGVVIGSSTNASYVEKVEKVEHFESGENKKEHVVINTEWSTFGDNGDLDFIRTQFDKLLDCESNNPGESTYEKMVSGMYMGELVRIILVTFTKARLLFNGIGSNLLYTKGKFNTKYLFQIECDEVGDYSNCYSVLNELNITNATNEDCANVRYICSCILTRSAHLVSCGVAVLINKVNEPNITIAIDGSVYRFHPEYVKLMCCKIRKLIEPSIEYSLMASEHGCGRGAALVTVAALRENKPNEATATVNADRSSLGKKHEDKFFKIDTGESQEQSLTKTQQISLDEKSEAFKTPNHSHARSSLDKKSDDKSKEAERNTSGKKSDEKTEINANESDVKSLLDEKSNDKSLKSTFEEKTDIAKVSEPSTLDKKSHEKTDEVNANESDFKSSLDNKSDDESLKKTFEKKTDVGTERSMLDEKTDEINANESDVKSSLDNKSDDESLKKTFEEKTDEAKVAERSTLDTKSDEKTDEINTNESDVKSSLENESDDVTKVAERSTLDIKSHEKTDEINANEFDVKSSLDNKSDDKSLKKTFEEKADVAKVAERSTLDTKSDEKTDEINTNESDVKSSLENESDKVAERSTLDKKSHEKTDEINANEFDVKSSLDNKSDDKSLKKTFEEKADVAKVSERNTLDKKSDEKTDEINANESDVKSSLDNKSDDLKKTFEEKTDETKVVVYDRFSRESKSDDTSLEKTFEEKPDIVDKPDKSLKKTSEEKADEATLVVYDRFSRESKSDDTSLETTFEEKPDIVDKPDKSVSETTSDKKPSKDETVLGGAALVETSSKLKLTKGQEKDNKPLPKTKPEGKNEKVVFERGSGLFDTDDSNDSDENPTISADAGKKLP